MLRFIVIMLVLLSCFDAMGAKPTGLSEPEAKPELYRLKNPIAQVQELLKSQGRYEGAVDGFMGSDLEQAIKQYQKEHGLSQTGKISRELIAHLENIGRVRALINRLDDVRQQRRDKAREALLSDPRTRKLLEEKDEQTADPTRDLSGCFKSPTTDCLLRAAVDTSRAVYEDDMRDWALGEILAAQVSVGMQKDAMETAGRIKDSRLIVAALTNIAKTHVREGKIEEAFSGLSLIPVAERRLSVLLEIARHYREKQEKEKLVQTVNNILVGAQTIESFESGLALQIEAAEILAAADSKRSLHLLDRMLREAERDATNGSRVTLMRQAANAMANIGHPEWALKSLEKMPDDETRVPILMAAARAFMKEGRFKAAQGAIERISADRYRSVIMADLGFYLWEADRRKEAVEALENAQTMARSIKLPFAMNYSLSHISQAQIKIAAQSRSKRDVEKALKILQEISDERLKARGLWDLSYAVRQNDIVMNEEDLGGMAQSAINEIKSKFSRAWILGDLVEIHQTAGDLKEARNAFIMGIAAVENLKNPWARSRALAKFATLSYRFD